MQKKDKSNTNLIGAPVFNEDTFTLIVNVPRSNEIMSVMEDLQEVARKAGLRPKEELHVTIIGFKNGQKIKENLEKFSESDTQDIVFKIQKLVNATIWSFALEPQQYRVARLYSGDVSNGDRLEAAGIRESYIEMVSLPALADFYSKLNELLGTALEAPPPHVTLYTKGEDPERGSMGVGIESWGDFNMSNPRPIQAQEAEVVFNKIILPTRPQPDTIVAIFLLKSFGKIKYPGIENASIDVASELPQGETAESLEKKGIIPLDVGGSRFDHHNKNTTATQLVAEDLGVVNNSSLAKVMQYAERDDKHGTGTISQDALDRAFGLSGLIAALNKTLPQDPARVVEYILPLLKAHYLEEKKRVEDVPREFEEKLKSNEAEVLQARHKGKKTKVVFVQSDNPSLTGWLRSARGLKADVVVQKNKDGYVNITTRQMKRIDLRWVTALLRQAEIDARAHGSALGESYLTQPGRIKEAPEWYYDRATNSILNGGIIQRGIEPTAISFPLVKELVISGLEVPVEKTKKILTPTPKICVYFLEIRVPLEAARNIRNMLAKIPSGMQAYLPENYRIVFMGLGKYQSDEVSGMIEAIQSVLLGSGAFSLTIDNKNFKFGIVPGYAKKSFYFDIGENDRGKDLGILWAKVRDALPHFPQQEFAPRLVVASMMPNVEERFIEVGSAEVREGARVEFPVAKVRLTQVIETPGKVTYRKKHEFAVEA